MLQHSGVRAPGVIKYVPADFVVREVHKNPDSGTSVVLGSVQQNDLHPRASRRQQFTLLKITKTGLPAQTAYDILAKELDVERWRLSDCGQKDAQAITTQYVVVEGSYVPRCRDERIKVQYLGPTYGPLTLGEHEANYFSILVRSNLRTAPVTDGVFVNYFGPQRFGQGTAEVGRLLIEGEIDEALKLLARTRNGRKVQGIASYQGTSLEAALFSPAFEHDRNFMIGQWRSFLWNTLVSQRLQLGNLPPEAVIPLWTPELASEYAHLWDCDESRIPAPIMELVQRGKRAAWAKAYQHEVVQHPHGWRHNFVLKPGCYATVFLANLYDLEDASLQR